MSAPAAAPAAPAPPAPPRDASARISVHLLPSMRRGYVWKAAEALALRRDCGIVGMMVGQPQRNLGEVMALPLELSPEEVWTCMRRGYVRVFPPSREAARGEEEAQGADAPAPAPAPAPAKRKRDDTTWVRYPYSARTLDVLADSKKTVVVPRLRNAREKQLADAAADGNVAAQPAEEVTLDTWDFPSDDEERVRCLVYEDIHRRGYRITGGCKFGADYLAYPDDPLRFHATMSVRVVTDWTEPFHARALSGFLRCSHAARKHAVFAGVQPSNDESTPSQVVYLTGMPDGGFAGVAADASVEAAAAAAAVEEEEADDDDDDLTADDDPGAQDRV